MKRFFTLFILIVLAGARSSAQYYTPQNYNWYFGTRAAVTFSSGAPVVLTNSVINTNEGCASVSNAAGTLLFYTDGDQIWDRTHNVMAGSVAGCANGYSTWSTTQGTLIVPVLSNPNRYYVFSIEEIEDYITGDAAASRLYYSIVDMTLNGGLGDVVAGTRATLFANPVSEKLIAIPGYNNNIWLVTHLRNAATFRVYEITTAGISTTPVVSTLGWFSGAFSYGIGVIKSSPNRRMIVAENWNETAATGFSGARLNGTELYDFDPCTGIVSNSRLLDSLTEGYGAEFSPDNTKLYVDEVIAASGSSRIAQYDVTGATAAAIRATKFTVATSANYLNCDMKLAVNNRIYFSTITTTGAPQYLSAINNPNVSGAGCGYANNVVTLSTTGYRYVNEGMPNVFQNILPADTTFTHQDTALCFSAGTVLTLTAPSGISYYWYDGATASTHTVTTTGNYWVNVTTACNVISDTFRVTSGSGSISGVPTMCAGSTTTLSSTASGGTWSSTTTSVATVSTSGVVTGVSGGTSTISYIAPSGCTASITVTVNVVSPISGPTTVCQGGTITLSDATAGGTWTSLTTSVATITSPGGVVSGVSPGSAVIRYTSPAGCITTTTITVNTTTPITGTLTICNGSTTTLSNATSGGTWASSNTSVATVGASSGVVTSVSGGNTVITYTTAAGCATTTTVTVYPISPITGASSVCVGGSTQLSDASAGGTWSSSNTGVATIGLTSGLVSSVSLGTTIIRYTMPSGCFTTYTLSVVSVVPISGNTNLCLGGTTTLSNSASGGTWASGNLPVATIGLTSGIISGVSVGNAPITYTIGTCVSVTTVTVNPLPANITGTTSLCAGTVTHLSDATPGGTWSSGSPSLATINTATGIVSGVSAGIVIITYWLPTGCYITTPVTINPLPPSVTGPASVCLGNTITLSDAASGGTWASGAPAVATISSSGVVTGVSIGSSNITYTLSTGCFITTTVSVGALPDAPVTADLVYCQDDTPVPPLTATGTALQWYTSATGGAPLGAAPVPSTATPGVFTWYVSQSSNGCEGPRAPLNVTVHLKPPKPFISPAKPTVCQYDTVGYTYTGIFFSGITYLWTVPSNASIASGSSTGSSIAVKFDTSIGNNYVTLTVSDGYTPCSVTDTATMIVNASAPDATFYVKPDVCVGDSVDVGLTYHPLGVYHYVWSFGPAGSYNIVVANSNSGGPYKIVWPQPGIYMITLTASSSAECPSRTVIDTVQVHPYPDARIAPVGLLSGRQDICAGDSVLLQPEEYNYQYVYTWAPAHFFTLNNKAKVYGDIQKAGYVTLTATDPFGCVATDSVYIDAKSCCVVSFPSAFTPNGDGLNDVFRPITVGHHSVHILRIDNRFGQTVFETVDEKGAWDGTFNGVPQDLGVYFYYFKYDCEGKTMIEKGDVTLVR